MQTSRIKNLRKMKAGIRIAVFAILVLFACDWNAVAQDTTSTAPGSGASEDRTRQLWNTQFQQKRPIAQAAQRSGAQAAQSAANSSPPPADALGDSLVGVTVWRLRPSQQDDAGVRIISSDNPLQWTPVRVEGTTPLAEGEKVRVGIEAARTGYLYVVDREQYKDGTYGAAYLIFPTLRLHGGENAVSAGVLIEIPSFGDNPPYLTMRASRPDQVAEVLTVIVAPQPLKEVQVSRDPIKIDPAQLQQWDRQWGSKVERLEARTQAGKAYTQAEKQAGGDHTRLLTHDDPLPQTMYHVDAKPGDPLMLDVPLRIGR